MTQSDNKKSTGLISLADLKLGEHAVIRSIDDETLAIHFMEMGCVPGEKITLQNKAPLGDPIAIKIAGYKLSLRKEDAVHILITKEE